MFLLPRRAGRHGQVASDISRGGGGPGQEFGAEDRGNLTASPKEAARPPRKKVVVGMKNRRGLSIKTLASPYLSSC